MGSGDLRKRFEAEADRWDEETGYLSSITQMAMHPSYQRIIGMGEPALPLILERLRERPDHWFWALYCISGEDVAVGTDTFDEATAAWLRWGRERGYLKD